VTGLRRCVARDESGNAIVEFVYLAVLLMVPLVYVLLTVFRVQAATYAVSSATREAGRVYVSSADSGAARGRALTAATIVMADTGLRLSPRDLHITCSAIPCLTPGATVNVSIGYDVALPLMPTFFGSPARVHVDGRHLEVVDRFRVTR
jgi:Flp pilus assembly protein TadG